MVEEDLSWIEFIKVGTDVDTANTKRICIHCTTQSSFGQLQRIRLGRDGRCGADYFLPTRHASIEDSSFE
jgi:hypothetical protein